ncbi:MAG: hypothetical protein KJ002_10450 [Candidatus Dadabacteria bacterium]|nr:hypothetical protein [Candidatus Dadabacteria bacterium]
MNGIIILFERQVISILSAALFAVIFTWVHTAPAGAADNYSAEEKVYLKTVTPILYEYSQIASQVSANVLPLQSAPPEKCSGEFSSYYGIMSSLGKHLGTITPPARFESVQANSASAIAEYETSLNLYSAACTQEDFGTKEELVSRASAGVNRSVARINKVYKEIESLGAVASAPPAAGSTARENLSESAIETAPSEEAVQIEEQYVTETPAVPAATPAPKTREEILEELSGTGDTVAAPEAVQPEKTAPAAPAVETPKAAAPPAVKAPEPVKPAPPEPAAPPAEAAKVEAPKAPAPAAPAVEPPPVETKAEPAPVVSPETAAPEPVPSPEAAAAPAPAATEEPAAAGSAVSPAEQAAVQEALKAAEEAGPPPPAPGDVTEKSTETAALAPEELKEEALPEDEINSWCGSRYQTDFERAECVKKRTAARDKAEVLSTSFEDGTPERDIVEKCRADWKEGVTYNYEMVVSCTQFFCNQKGLEACTQLAK